MSESEIVLAELLERCRRDHHAWINGDGTCYELPADGTIFGAVGGYSFGGTETAGRQQAVAAQWHSGEGEIEFVNGAVLDDVAWLALIERAQVVLVGSDATRRWDNRVTEVFRRRSDGAWERVHRQADPFVDRRAVGDVMSLVF